MLSRSRSTQVFRVRFLALLGFLGLMTCSLGVPSSFALLLQASGTWTLTGQMSNARKGAAAAVLLDGTVLVAGGTDASGNVLASAEIYGAGGVFQLTATPMNFPRTGHTATVLYRGRVLVAGGSSTTAPSGVVLSAEIYDPGSKVWYILPSSLMQPRTGHTATLLTNGAVLLAGGQDFSGMALNTLELYIPGTTPAFVPVMSTMSSPRFGHAAAALYDGRVFIAGGTDGSTVWSTTDIYDPSTGLVTAGPPLNTARSAATATTLLDGTVLIAGGTDGTNTPLATAEIFDPLAGTITALTPTLSYARAGQLAFLLPHNNNVLLDGGVAGGADLASAELYTPWSNAFSLTGSMNAARSQAPGGWLAPLQNGSLLVAGGSSVGTVLRAAELYGFATLQTDRGIYPPGGARGIITGSGWTPGETVNLSFQASPGGQSIPSTSATADKSGNIGPKTFFFSAGSGTVYYLTAVGRSSGFQARVMFWVGARFICGSCVSGGPPWCDCSVAQPYLPSCQGLPPKVTYGISPIRFLCTPVKRLPPLIRIIWVEAPPSCYPPPPPPPDEDPEDPPPGDEAPPQVVGPSAPATYANSLLTIPATGVVTVTVSQPASSSFKKESRVSYSMTVNRAPLTVTAPTNVSLKYGVPFHASQFPPCTVQGLVNGDTANPPPEFTSTVTKTSPVGTYGTHCLRPREAKLLANYSIAYVDGSLTIVANPAAITLSPRAGVLSFPPTKLGASSQSKTFTLLNQTGTNVTFTVSQPSANFSLSANSCSVATGVSCTFMVYFQPQSVATQEETLTITAQDAAGDPPATNTVTLRGTGKKK